MKILAIRGENLASLARSFEIDLVRGPIAGAGIFAITGPVGAGKTTLLDALCLPLFDRTPRLSGRGGAPVGDDGDDREGWLRAHDPRTLLRRDAGQARAEVDFIGRDGVRYRAMWSVRRARRRADGRVQDQELLLTDLDRGVVVASGRRSDVLAAVQQRLGLDFAQFCRSVLLAQGDFAAFLRASADERARLLETLTGADVYRRLSKAAHERARAAAAEIERVRAQFDAQAPLAAGERAAAEGASAQLGAEATACRVAITLASGYVIWHEAAEQHRRGESEAAALVTDAMAAHAAAGPRREQLARRQRAMTAVARWEVAQAAQAAARASAGAARHAAASLQASAERAAAAERRLQAALREAFGDGVFEAPAIVGDLPRWEPLLRQWRDAEVALEGWQRSLPQCEATVLAAKRQSTAVVGEVAAAAAVLLEANARLEAARQAAERGDAAASATLSRDLEVRRAQHARFTWSLDAWRRAASLHTKANERRDAAAAAGERERHAVAAAQAVGEARAAARVRDQECVATLRAHAGLADLRTHLVDGEACPLCGSRAHALTPLPTPDDVAAASARLAASEHELAVADRELARARGDLQANAREQDAAGADAANTGIAVAAAAQACAQAAGADAAAVSTLAAATAQAAALAAAIARDVAAAENAATAARETTRALASAVGAAAAANAAWQRLEQRRLAEEQAVHAAMRARDDAQASGERERARLADLRAALAPACTGLPGDVAALAALPHDRLARVRSLHALDGERTVAARAAAVAAAEGARLATIGQRDADEAAAAERALARQLAIEQVELADVAAASELGNDALAAEASALQSLADAVERCRTIAQERFHQRRRHENHERPSLDAEEAAAALRDARASLDAVERKLREAQVRLHADDLVRRQRNEIAPRLQTAERAFATWGALDGLIGSSTGDEFAVFAQGLTLDLLLLEANRRLAELARRYRLQRNPEAALDFIVVDLDLGGSRRSLQTLSGGETFLVSLAMALALATLAAPKARVETLFLDEGFGTLDAQSLEVALGALDSLQATGCQVGVISHVDGIAERIGAQVVVQPEGGGQSRVTAHAR